MYKTQTEQKYSRMEKTQAKKLHSCATVMKAIAHPMRLQIIELLYRENRKSVKDIYEELQINQAVASHHLGILKDKNILDCEREGKNIYYFLREKSINEVIQNLADLTVV